MPAKGHRLSPEARAKISAAAKRQWSDPEHRNRHKAAMSAAMTPAKREAVSERFRALWQDPDYRERWLVQRRARPVQTDEERKAAKRAYYEQNSEKIKARSRAWHAANLEAARSRAREYAREHAAEARRRYDAWIARPENRERVNAWNRAYSKAHPEARLIQYHRRRARLLGQFVEDVDRRIVLERHGGICGWCSKPVDPADWHLDHIVALVHGGEHSYANTQPVHPACNYEKRTVLKERAA